MKTIFAGASLLALAMAAPALAQNNESTINQTGTENGAYLYQGGDDNTSTIGQTGNNNVATVLQFSDGNTSSVTQNGSGNTATVTQGAGVNPFLPPL